MKKINEETIKNIIKVTIILAAVIGMILLVMPDSKSAYFSNDINGIDESKYPGYKEELQQLAKLYPNITLFYTGLDWDTVIENERVHSRNLVPKTYSEEWRCPECGDKLYDSGWYCASDEAVEYLMDPRVYLNQDDIFQFQKLDSSSGTLDKNAINFAVQGTFLNTPESVDAIYNGAKNNNINSFHLITRMIQEQGSSGNTTLIKGAAYKGIDGVTYEGLYNVFNISAYGNSYSEIITNGFKKAKEQNWTSLALSITGGSSFMKTEYLTKGQNTLYLQKFDVDNTSNGLYWHQYMQNLLGARSESYIMKDMYEDAKLLLNRDFEFVIPIYENMPDQASPEPGADYVGSVNSELRNLNLGENGNGAEYIYGEIDIAEYINGTGDKPKSLPEIWIKSLDGTYSSEIFVEYRYGITYYFDKYINTLDPSKDYYLEVKLSGSNNIASIEQKTQKVKIAENKKIGDVGLNELYSKDNNLIFVGKEYIGEVVSELQYLKVGVNPQGAEYIYGNIIINEKIEDSIEIPRDLPKMTLKDTTGKVVGNLFVSNVQDNTYYFDRYIEGIDINKDYYIEVSLTTKENVAEDKLKNKLVEMNQIESIGKYNKDYTMYLENNKIIFVGKEYIGTIETTKTALKLGVNSSGDEYIYGEINIYEIINGVRGIPVDLPRLILKSEDGTVVGELFVNQISGNTYYFDRYINTIDLNKKYYIKVGLSSRENVASIEEKNIKADLLSNVQIGVTNNANTFVVDSMMLFKYDGYIGTINTDLKEIKLGKNSSGNEYIYGNIDIAMWQNGICKVPQGEVQMSLRSVDGIYSTEIFISNIGGITYYFDKYVDSIDITKQYYIEVKLVDKYNMASSSTKVQTAKIRKTGEIGTVNGNILSIESNIFKFENSNGEIKIDSKITSMKLAINSSKSEYIYGNIEISTNTNSTNQSKIALTLKSTDGKYSSEMFIDNISGTTYYYDKYIENLDQSKQYYIELEIGDIVKNVNIDVSGNIGDINGNTMKIELNKIVFDINGYIGTINTDLIEVKLGKNSSSDEYIYGEIDIAEWINGVCYKPSDTPKITLKSTDGTYSSEMFVSYRNGITYYFDKYINYLDTSKQYYIEVELTGADNTASKDLKIQTAQIRQTGVIGQMDNLNISISNNIFSFKNN